MFTESQDIKAIIIEVHRNLSSQLSQIRGLLTDIQIRQKEQDLIIAQGKILNKIQTIETCIEEHQLGTLPYKTLNEFEIFDEQLKSDKSVRSEMVNSNI